MEGYNCPICLKKKDPDDRRKGLRTELHFEQIQGIRVYIEEGKKKIYNVYCPKCDEYMQVDEYNKIFCKVE